MQRTSRKVYMIRRVAALAVLAVLILAAVLISVSSGRRKQAHKEAYDVMSVWFLDDASVNGLFPGTHFEGSETGGRFEYGSETVEPVSLIGSHTCQLDVVDDKVIDTSVPGEYEITYRLTNKDRYGKTVTKDVVMKYTVEDTAAPVIRLREPNVTVYKGEEFDPKDNIISAEDPVDGAVEYSVSGSVNTSSVGQSTIEVTASDRKGNTARESFNVSVEEFKPASTPSDGILTYAVRVNKAANTLTVYKRDQNGEYTIPYKAMVCSTGEDTPDGTYYTYDDPSNSKWAPRYPWWPLYGGVYGMYATGIVGSVLFHSVPYYSPDPSDLEYEEYNKLGTSASAGCVRLSVRDVMWIFSHCPKGTMVTFYDDESDPGPLGKPEPVRIDTTSPNRGWDPTDPDPENPWND